MGKYVYKRLSALDIIVLLVFVLTPVWLLTEPFIVGFLFTAIPMIIVGLYAAMLLVWLIVGVWWLLSRIRP